MKRFSQREGYTEVKDKIQIESMDKGLRNRLWNVLDFYYWTEDQRGWRENIYGKDKALFRRMWHNFLKIPINTLPSEVSDVLSFLRTYFFECEWFEIYDFIEYIANTYEDEEINEKFKKTCNTVLEEELSAYRFVDNQIVKLTSKVEIDEIEESLKTPFASVNAHMETALCLMADRKSPDYRNSIKESISGVEAICQIIAEDEDASLTKALRVIEEKISLNKNLKEAFRNLYHYTSSSEGIRHAIGLLEEPNLNFEDAKFMLVSCSAFINYLISKASKAGILKFSDTEKA